MGTFRAEPRRSRAFGTSNLSLRWFWPRLISRYPAETETLLSFGVHRGLRCRLIESLFEPQLLLSSKPARISMRSVSPPPTRQPESLCEFVDTSDVSKPFQASRQHVPNLRRFSLRTRQKSSCRSCAVRCPTTTFPKRLVVLLAMVEVSGKSLSKTGSFRVNIGKPRCREDR